MDDQKTVPEGQPVPVANPTPIPSEPVTVPKMEPVTTPEAPAPAASAEVV